MLACVHEVNVSQSITCCLSASLPWTTVCRGMQIALDVARGLAFLHRRKIAHLE